MLFLDIAIIVFIGLALGSFTTAITYRIPRDIPWAFQKKSKAGDDVTAFRSACTHCKTNLRVIDLIPVFSWTLTKGLCRYCQKPIGKLYPLIELGTLLACVGIYLRFGLSVDAYFLIALVPFLMALLAIDLEYTILPDQLVAITGGIGFLWLFNEAYTDDNLALIAEHCSSAVVYALLAWGMGWCTTKVLKKEALGFGDVKFFAVAGLWLGFSNLAAFCLLSGLFGVFFGVVWQAIVKKDVFPFGPALIVAFYVLLLSDGYLVG